MAPKLLWKFHPGGWVSLLSELWGIFVAQKGQHQHPDLCVVGDVKAISVHMSGVGHPGALRAKLNSTTPPRWLLSVLVPCLGDVIFVQCGFLEVSPLFRIKWRQSFSWARAAKVLGHKSWIAWPKLRQQPLREKQEIKTYALSTYWLNYEFLSGYMWLE